MFFNAKRPPAAKPQERDHQALLAASSRLIDALLHSSVPGIFIVDSKGRIQTRISLSLTSLFRREDFTELSLDKLIEPFVTPKVLATARAYVAGLLEATVIADVPNPLLDVEMRLPNTQGNSDVAHYCFEFTPIDAPQEARSWLVRVTDISTREQQQRELEDLRAQAQVQGEMLRSVLCTGRASFGAFLQKTDAAMKSINDVLKKPARAAAAFRLKLEATLEEVDRVRRDAAGLRLCALEAAARNFEDALQDLRARDHLSGGDFLPLAVKLDQLYGQFALLRSLAAQSGPRGESNPHEPYTDNGTRIISAPQFDTAPGATPTAASAEAPAGAAAGAPAAAKRMAPAGSLHATLSTLTDLVAQEQQKLVYLECAGLEGVPPRYQATIKNTAIQLIRNAVLHGMETQAEREQAGKPAAGTLRLEFRTLRDGSFELLFQDDGRGLDPQVVRSTAVARGLVTEAAVRQMRDRQVIKLIFKSGYTTLNSVDGEAPHGAGMSLVRRYVHEAGGKVALASFVGRETRFKVTLPALPIEAAQVA